MIKEIEKINHRPSEFLVFEGMTSIRAIISAIDQNINNRKIHKILYDINKIQKIGKTIGYLKAVSDKYGFEVVESCADEIEKYCIGTSHGGIIALCGSRVIPHLSEATDISDSGFYCMLEGIEDPYNFGYALRSLYAVGCCGIILPERNWMSAAGIVSRSSAGASELFRMYRADSVSAATFMRSRGYRVVCADENTDQVLGKCELRLPLFLIVGGEKRGISAKLMELTDIKVKIDYAQSFNASLSAASAATIFAYEIMRQNK